MNSRRALWLGSCSVNAVRHRIDTCPSRLPVSLSFSNSLRDLDQTLLNEILEQHEPIPSWLFGLP